MSGWLEGIVALVTGGGSGIGRAVVARFVDEGANVGVLDRDEAEVANLQYHFGDRVLAIAGDAASTQDMSGVVAAVIRKFGRLDTFVGNAAIFDYSTRLEDISNDDLSRAFDELFSVNVKGCLVGARATIDVLRRNGGNMIFTVSNSGFYAGGGGVLYVASKHAVVGVIRQLAFELAPEVRVNGVAPGGTMTSLRGTAALGQADRRLRDSEGLATMVARGTPLGFIANPEDHAGLYVLLASKNNSRAVTGAIIHSDGGLEVRGGGRRQRPPASAV